MSLFILVSISLILIILALVVADKMQYYNCAVLLAIGFVGVLILSFYLLMVQPDSRKVVTYIEPTEIVVSSDEVSAKYGDNTWIHNNSVKVYKAATNGGKLIVQFTEHKNYYNITMSHKYELITAPSK